MSFKLKPFQDSGQSPPPELCPHCPPCLSPGQLWTQQDFMGYAGSLGPQPSWEWAFPGEGWRKKEEGSAEVISWEHVRAKNASLGKAAQWLHP